MRVFVLALLCSLLSAQAPLRKRMSVTNHRTRARVWLRTLTDPSRDARQSRRNRSAESGIKTGMTVVDLGTGPGDVAIPGCGVRLSKLIAEDIFPDFLQKARETNGGIPRY